MEQGPHLSAQEPDAIAQMQIKVSEKVAQGLANIYLWEDPKKDLPKAHKLPPLAMILQMSLKYRAILGLSFALRINGYHLSSVNEESKKCVPMKAMGQLGTALPRIIEALAFAPTDEDGGSIMMSKLDIKDGFWRMVCEAGQEWKFSCILPNRPDWRARRAPGGYYVITDQRFLSTELRVI